MVPADYLATERQMHDQRQRTLVTGYRPSAEDHGDTPVMRCAQMAMGLSDGVSRPITEREHSWLIAGYRTPSRSPIICRRF